MQIPALGGQIYKQTGHTFRYFNQLWLDEQNRRAFALKNGRTAAEDIQVGSSRYFETLEIGFGERLLRLKSVCGVGSDGFQIHSQGYGGSQQTS